MNRLDKIRAQHAEHDMSDSDEFYLLGRVTELESAMSRIFERSEHAGSLTDIRQIAREAIGSQADLPGYDEDGNKLVSGDAGYEGPAR
jgi:hypothetical protein